MKRQTIYVLILTFLALTSLQAQNREINGKIIDEKSQPIIGAYIIHLSSEHHAHSNELGTFFIKEVNQGDTLQISHVGYETQLFIVQELNQPQTIRLKEKIFEIDEVVIEQDINALNQVTDMDLRTYPVVTAQEVLRRVPGLFIGQHAGGGKAEQIFLRGFDIDHGTDVNLTVDGMPVNMVSHAHGQGYADMHFLIPETIDQIDFGKGPYYAHKGNFNTAGYVDFETKNRLDNSLVKLEYGRFNTFRSVGLFNLVNTEKNNAYLAAEYTLTDGPFDASQNFTRFNLMGKYTGLVSGRDRFSVLFSHFTSKWDASGQIPDRAVASGLIGRFGAIDNTEGGSTSRSNVMVEFIRNLNPNTFLKSHAFYSHYTFELFSNFTFFLEDPINGDQIRQREARDILGFETQLNHFFYTNNAEANLQIGAGIRYDDIDDNELSFTRNRRNTIRQIQFGDVDESNIYTYVNLEFELGKWLINPAVRVDYFKFNYVDELDSAFVRQQANRLALSPKLNIIYNYNQNFQLFLKSGIGFHSNDARVVLDQSGEDILPAAYGADLGFIWKPLPRLYLNAAFWYLYLEQEFVYVGDAGIVEPSGETQRLGVDFGLRYQILDWLFFDGDINYAFARAINEPEGEDFIPLAPDLTATGGLTVRKGNFSGGIRFRYLADRPANEDESIIARGYFITDLNLSYEYKRLQFGLIVENLFDRDWNETQFATESRLSFETESVEEIHFTPGTPISLRANLAYKF